MIRRMRYLGPIESRFRRAGVQPRMTPQFESYAQGMMDETDLVTVYRSADTNAEEDATAVRDILLKGGFHPYLVGDDAPDVVTGTYEVRVPRAEVESAEAALGGPAIG